MIDILFDSKNFTHFPQFLQGVKITTSVLNLTPEVL